MTHRPLKLFARAAEDMDIISAHTQDAVLQTGDMAFLDDQRRVPERQSLRVRSALQIGSILSARRRNIRTDQGDGVLSILALRFEAEDAPAGTVSIIFSGGGEIRLAVETCEAILEDITEPWAATRRPAHDANA